MDTDTLKTHTTHLLAAIENLITNKFSLPALILMYSTIDAMAWLNRDEQHEDVTRSDFVLWVESFLLPDSGLSCTGTDLYAARCSVVHSCTPESRLSREGKAREIFYAWGNAREQDLEGLIARSHMPDTKVVHVGKLYAALNVGINRFLPLVQQDGLLRERAERLFTNMPR